MPGIICDPSTVVPVAPIAYTTPDGLAMVASDLAIATSPTATNTRAIDLFSGTTAAALSGTAGFTFRGDNLLLETGDGEPRNTNVSGAPGRFGDGVRVDNRGQGSVSLFLNTSSVTTSGWNAMGAYAWQRNFNANSASNVTLEANGVTITTSGGGGAHALQARSDTGLGDVSSIVSDSTLVTSGRGSGIRAIIVSNPPAGTPQTSGSVTTRVQSLVNPMVIRATDRGVAAFTNNLGAVNIFLSGDGAGISVETSGDNNAAVFANNSNSQSAATITVEVDAARVDLVTGGNGSTGIRAEHAGAGGVLVDWRVDAGSIATSGDNAFGIFAWIGGLSGTGDAVVSMSGNSAIATQGVDSYGIFSLQQGDGQAIIHMSGGTIVTSGAGADGLFAVNSGSGSVDVDVTGGSITSGTGMAAGIHTVSANGGTIDIGASSVINGSASGIAIRDGDADRDGVDETGGNVVVTTAGTVWGDAILGLGDDVFRLVGGDFHGDIYGDDVAGTGADGNDAFHWTGGNWYSSFFGGNGSDTANISAAAYDGTHHVLDGGDDVSAADGWIDMLTFSGITANANGANIRNWEVVRLDGTNLTILDGALAVGSEAGLGLSLTSGSTLDGLNALALTGNMSIDATSSFLGTGGGAGEYSISGSLINNGRLVTQDNRVGDRVAIAGNYSGSGRISLDIDTAKGSADSVVIAGNTNGSTVVEVNNVSPANVSGADISLIVVDGSSSVGDFSLAGGTLTAGAFDYYLAYGAGRYFLAASLNSTGIVYEAAASILSGFQQMPTWEQRKSAWTRFHSGHEQAGRGGWVRLHGSQVDTTNDKGSAIDSNAYGAQAGWNLQLNSHAESQWILGVTAQHGKQDSRVSNADKSGSINLEGFGAGATATWSDREGGYVDIQGQLNWIEGNISSSSAGSLAEGQWSRASMVGAEAGWRIALDRNHKLVPQGQLTFTHVNGASFIDKAGNPVSLGNNSNLVGRIGLAYEWEPVGKTSESRQKIYAIANILHDFSGNGTVDVAGASLGARIPDTWGEVGLGASLDLGDEIMLYGEASHSSVLGESLFANSAQQITVGLRYQW